MLKKQILTIITGVAVVAVIGLLPAPPDKPVDAHAPEPEESTTGTTLPLTWGEWRELNRQLIETGVIDQTKFDSVAELDSGALAETPVVITPRNAGGMLNWLWAFGLGNKNEILEEGPMTDPKYGGDPGRFASTGGWTAAVGDPMSHYSHHRFVVLSAEAQARVTDVSQDIYRPCCSNPAYFPDCNHGMAMLGLLELLADQGLDEAEMKSIADEVNAYWFPELAPASSC